MDEAQVVSEKPGSAEMLNNAVITFRKFGGIVTLAMQNVVAALANKKMVELFQNCSYKCFLDQGGVDAQSLAEIQPLSEREFRALGTGKPGEGVIVWNKKWCSLMPGLRRIISCMKNTPPTSMKKHSGRQNVLL